MSGQKNDYGKRSHYQSDNPLNGGGKRRNPEDERESNAIGPEDTVYRYLCPNKKIGSIIGRGGDIVKQLRSETQAKIRINDTVLGCEERVVIIYSSSEETNRPKIFRDFSETALNIGSVIGKGGVIIKQIRQESGAMIKVDSSASEGDDCLITVSAKEAFQEPSPTIDAVLRLQPRCSEKTEREPGDAVFTTRLLVPASRIGCLIGKGGAIISEMRSLTRASIRILSKENLPKVASEDEEMVQITGDINVVSSALLQVTTRLRANIFETSGYASSSGRYDSEFDGYGSYGGSQIGGSGYGPYGAYTGRMKP